MLGKMETIKISTAYFRLKEKTHMIYLNSILSGQLLQFLENFALWVYDKGHSNASRILRIKSAIELKYFLVQLCSDALDIVTQCLRWGTPSRAGTAQRLGTVEKL